MSGFYEVFQLVILYAILYNCYRHRFELRNFLVNKKKK